MIDECYLFVGLFKHFWDLVLGGGCSNGSEVEHGFSSKFGSFSLGFNGPSSRSFEEDTLSKKAQNNERLHTLIERQSRTHTNKIRIQAKVSRTRTRKRINKEIVIWFKMNLRSSFEINSQFY